jgi:hypothetical protein
VRQDELFPPTTEEKQAMEDRETLWKIWDILHLWNDEAWSSDEIAMVADVMLEWTGTHDLLPPEEYRFHDDDMYRMEAD